MIYEVIYDLCWVSIRKHRNEWIIYTLVIYINVYANDGRIFHKFRFWFVSWYFNCQMFSNEWNHMFQQRYVIHSDMPIQRFGKTVQELFHLSQYECTWNQFKSLGIWFRLFDYINFLLSQTGKNVSQTN